MKGFLIYFIAVAGITLLGLIFSPLAGLLALIVTAAYAWAQIKGK